MIKIEKINNDVKLIVDDKEFILDNDIFNYIASNLLRTKCEIEYLNSRNMNDNRVLVDDYATEINVSLLIKKNNDKIYLNINDKFTIFILNDDLNDINNVIYNYYYKEYNFDFRNIDPVYFSIFLWKLLPKINNFKIDKILLDDLRVSRWETKLIKLEETACYRTLVDKNKANEIFTPFKSNHVCQSDLERLEEIFESVKNNGYGYNNQLIVLYNDEYIIRDGQHRACSLKMLNKDKYVDVLRIYFSK